MEKRYWFKVGVVKREGINYLSIRDYSERDARHKKETYPITFYNLFVPFLDDGKLRFEGCFNEDWEDYFDAYKIRTKQKKVLSDLEGEVDGLIKAFLEGDKTLIDKEKGITFISDNGLEHPRSDKRYGNPKTERKPRTSKNYVRNREKDF